MRRLILKFHFHRKIGKQLIAYVKAWQNVLNDQAKKYGFVAFTMNTYTIAVFVIFFMELKHGIPSGVKLQLKNASRKNPSTAHSLGELVSEFFTFYGSTAEFKTHQVSVNAGEWQPKRPREQSGLASQRNRLEFGSY